MSFLHSREHLNRRDTVIVNCSHQANIMVMSDSNFSNYQSGDQFQYHGGHYKRLPAQIPVPTSGNWNIVIDLGGGSARISHSIQIRRAA